MSQTVKLEIYLPNVRAAFVAAQSSADANRNVEVHPEHLLVALLDRGWGKTAIARAGGDPDALLAQTRKQVDALARNGNGESYLSNALLALMSRAESNAARLARATVDLECLFRAFDGSMFLLDPAPWSDEERTGGLSKPSVTPPKRVTFEMAISRSARVLQEIAPRVLGGSKEQAASFRVLLTLDRIVTSFLPPYHPPDLEIEQPSRGEVVLRRKDTNGPRVVCSGEPPESVVVTVHGATGAASRRFAWNDDDQTWRSEDGEELFTELRDIVLALYPEIG